MDSTADVELVARLVEPSDQMYHLNEVSGVTTDAILFSKRRFISVSGFEIIEHPISACVGIECAQERPVSHVAGGLALVLLIGAILYFLADSWDSLAATTSIPIGALGVAGFFGLRRVFRSRRHKILFQMRNGTILRWHSRPGEFDSRAGAVHAVTEFARRHELLHPAGTASEAPQAFYFS